MRDSYRDLTFEELVTKREEVRQQFRQLRYDIVVGHVDNPLQKRVFRRRIARLNTLIYNHPDVTGEV